MIERKATIRNEQGIHCRPSSTIIKEVLKMPGDIEVIGEVGACNLRSIMGLLSLGLSHGVEITIRVAGPDEEASCTRLVELFETEFDFPPED